MARASPPDLRWLYRGYYWQAVTRDDESAVTPDGEYFIKAVKHHGIHQLLRLRKTQVVLGDIRPDGETSTTQLPSDASLEATAVKETADLIGNDSEELENPTQTSKKTPAVRRRANRRPLKVVSANRSSEDNREADEMEVS